MDANSKTKKETPVFPVFYDGNCAFCIRAVEIIRKLDILHKFTFLNFREPSIAESWKGLDLARAEKEMLVFTQDQRWLGGFQAFRWMSWRLPVFWIFAPFLYVPGISHLGERVYPWIAEHRYLFMGKVQCDNQVCHKK